MSLRVQSRGRGGTREESTLDDTRARREARGSSTCLLRVLIDAATVVATAAAIHVAEIALLSSEL